MASEATASDAAHVEAHRPLQFDPIEEARTNWARQGWTPKAAAGMAAMTSVVRVEQLFRARLERALSVFGLTMARYEMLVLLSFTRNGSMSLTRLGERLQVRPASVTPVVAKLVEMRLVRRVQDPRDGRSALATITPQGRRVATAAAELLNAEVYPATGLDDAELELLVSLLARVRAAEGDFVANGTAEQYVDLSARVH